MHEHSVVSALAELEQIEHERVTGERRRAAEQRLRAIEREVERRADERLRAELAASEARLVAAHVEREAALHGEVERLTMQLAASYTARDTLREALATLARPIAPRAAPRSRARLVVVAVAVAVAVLGALTLTPAPASVAQHAVPERARPAPVAPSSSAALPDSHAGDVDRAEHPQPAPASGHAVQPSRPARARPHPAPSRPVKPIDVLGPIDGCGDDPTCGL